MASYRSISGNRDLSPFMPYTEKAHRDQLKAAGGRWDPEAKLWYVSYGTIRGTALEERIVADFIKGKRGS